MFSEEHLYSLALRKCNRIGDIIFMKLIELEGSAENVWKLKKQQLTAIFGIGNKIGSEIGKTEYLKFAEQELAYSIKHNISIALKHQNELPKLLNDCEDAPAILYYKGDLLQNHNHISMVGTRSMTAYGKSFVNDFLKEAKEQNLATVSGLAIGVDTEVHIKSLEFQIPTIAVLAHGFTLLYPAKNRALSEKILENSGALVTEFSSEQKPDRQNFLQRNRVIAGFSNTLIVVETAFGGGSMNTASYANLYNRDVFALPGKITDKYSQGCNHLISKNKAATISSISDLVKELGIDEKNNIFQPNLFSIARENLPLSDPQWTIYITIREFPLITLDELSIRLNLAAFKLLPDLLEMELSGYIKTFSGKQFQVV